VQFAVENVSVYMALASYGENSDLYRRALTISLLMSPKLLVAARRNSLGAPPERPGQEGIPR
jgi:hypothetical protein